MITREHSLFTVTAVFMIGLALATQANIYGDEKTDILLIMLDDAGYSDFGCYGSEVDTPNIDRLAEKGIRLTDCHAAAPNCSPSRAGLLTGRMPTRVGIYSYLPPRHPMHLRSEEITVAEALRPAGYATGHFGKWHLSQLEWDSSIQPQPQDQGFDHSLGTTNNASPSHKNPTNFVRNGEAVGKIEGFSCQIVADEFISWSGDLPEDSPFLGVIWFNEPHTPIGSPDHLIAKYRKKYPSINQGQAKYYANIENVDLATGRIIDHLQTLGRLENTFIFLTSDNGGVNSWSNQGLRGKKSFVYEGGHREPGIIHWPKAIREGRVVDETVSHLDIFPTICEIGGVGLPTDRVLDGISLMPLIRGGSIERTTPLFWFFYRVKPAAAMRDGDWLITGYLDDPIEKHTHPLTAPDMPMIKSAPLERFELFHLGEDLMQSEDVQSSHPEIFGRLVGRMRAMHKEVIGDGPDWDLSEWKP